MTRSRAGIVSICRWIVAVALVAGLAGTSAAEPPSIDDFFPDYSMKNLKLSPSGDALAYISTTDTPHKLVVVDLSDMSVLLSLTGGSDRLSDVSWATDDRLLLTAIVPQAVLYRGKRILSRPNRPR